MVLDVEEVGAHVHAHVQVQVDDVGEYDDDGVVIEEVD